MKFNQITWCGYPVISCASVAVGEVYQAYEAFIVHPETWQEILEHLKSQVRIEDDRQGRAVESLIKIVAKGES